MSPPRTSVTDEPIEAGRYGRIPLGYSGLNIVHVAEVTPRGAVMVRELDESGDAWCKAGRVAATDIWFLLSPAEVRAAHLPAVP